MRASGPLDDTWRDDGQRPEGDRSPMSEGETLETAKLWRAKSAVRRLQILMQATEPALADREMAFNAMANELWDALEHLRNLISLAEQMKADNIVLRKAVERQRMKDSPSAAATEPSS